MKSSINILDDNLKIKSRRKNVTHQYLLGILRPADKHSLTNASIKGTLNKSQYCRHLQNSPDDFKRLLEVESQLACLELVKNGIKPLETGSKFKVALIFDSTLQERASSACKNAQKFNLGSGYAYGHKWTNCILYLNDQSIPLPPIKFLTKKQCEKLNLNHATEHNKVAEAINKINGLMSIQQMKWLFY